MNQRMTRTKKTIQTDFVELNENKMCLCFCCSYILNWPKHQSTEGTRKEYPHGWRQSNNLRMNFLLWRKTKKKTSNCVLCYFLQFHVIIWTHTRVPYWKKLQTTTKLGKKGEKWKPKIHWEKERKKSKNRPYDNNISHL